MAYKNNEGYNDPAAGKAITWLDSCRAKARFLIKVVRFIIWEAGFRCINKIEIEDRYTGEQF